MSVCSHTLSCLACLSPEGFGSLVLRSGMRVPLDSLVIIYFSLKSEQLLFSSESTLALNFLKCYLFLSSVVFIEGCHLVGVHLVPTYVGGYFVPVL